MDKEEAQNVLRECKVEGGLTTGAMGSFKVSPSDNTYVYTIYPPMTDEQGQPLSQEQMMMKNTTAISALHTLYPKSQDSTTHVAVFGGAKHPQSQIIQVSSTRDHPPHALNMLALEQSTRKLAPKPRPQTVSAADAIREQRQQTRTASTVTPG